MPVCTLVTTTTACGTTAPVESVIVPAIVAVSCWANAAAGKAHSNAASTLHSECRLTIVCSPRDGFNLSVAGVLTVARDVRITSHGLRGASRQADDGAAPRDGPILTPGPSAGQ